MFNIFKQNHPKGLYLLFFIEMWERFSYYGMRALLLLYMIKVMMYETEKAGEIYGFFTGFVYLTPLIGGYIADKFLGQRKCVELGGLLMALGLFLLASGIKILFLPSLFIMIIANGFFKSNISSILGLLYGDNDSKKDSGYTIFYMGINLGSFFSPLICGTLAVKYSFEYGFAAAGIGMLVGYLCLKIFGKKYLGDVGLFPIKNENISAIENIKENKDNKNKLISLLILMIFTTIFFACFEQAGSSLTLFALYSTDRNFLGYTIPVSYFQALNPLYIIILAPLISAFWEYLREKGKEPSSTTKFALSLFLISLSLFIMVLAAKLAENQQVSAMWLIISYFIATISELCISPIGLSLVSKLAPKGLLSMIMGCWFLSSFFGNIFAGFWGGKYEKLGAEHIFLMLSIISILSCLILILIKKKLKKQMGEV